MTALVSHDQGFVAVPRAPVYDLLADLPSYPTWWPGIAVAPDGPGLKMRLDRLGYAAARPDRHRPGIGLFVMLGRPYRGSLEWYLEPFEDGTVINGLLDVDLPGAPRPAQRRLRRLRVAVHRGFMGLRDRLE